MSNCRQACPYNTLDGCKVKEYNAICPLTNIATPITGYRMTNADRIRAWLQNDENLASISVHYDPVTDMYTTDVGAYHDFVGAMEAELEWLKQPAEGE